MLGGFEAALAFLMLVMPGLLLIGGYYAGLGRTQAMSQSAVHTLAQAIAWSVIFLAPAAYFLSADIANWIDEDTLDEHLTTLFLAGYATLLLPFPFGALIGWFARSHPRLADQLGSGTGWGVVGHDRGDCTLVRVSFADKSPTVEGSLDFRESRLEPGAFLTLREVAGDDGTPRDLVVASDGVRAVEFLHPPTHD